MKSALRWLDEHLEEYLLCGLLAAMAVLMGLQVFFRFALHAPLSWTEELTRYLFIWSGFLSLSFCAKRGLAIRITQFLAVLPHRLGRALGLLGSGAELAFFLYLIPFALSYLRSAVHSGQVSPACGLPMAAIHSAPLVAFCLVSVRLTQRLIRALRAPACPDSAQSDATREA